MRSRRRPSDLMFLASARPSNACAHPRRQAARERRGGVGCSARLDRLFYSRQSDSTAFLNGSSSFCDAAQEFRVMLKAIVEPVVLRCKPDKDACRPPVTRDDDLFVDG